MEKDVWIRYPDPVLKKSCLVERSDPNSNPVNIRPDPKPCLHLVVLREGVERRSRSVVGVGGKPDKDQ